MENFIPPTQAELDAMKRYGCLTAVECDRLITEVERLRTEYQATVEDHDEEIGEFQNAAREEIIKLTGTPDSAIDGKGSDAGWDEFTLAEISQGIGFLKDRLTKEVEELRKDKERLQAILAVTETIAELSYKAVRDSAMQQKERDEEDFNEDVGKV